jgi:endonuclease/exonuclease/phosphatase family metal-dependent hydrolase
MRIMNWNIEWMNDWFVGYGNVAFRNENPGRGISNVQDLCQRVAAVIQTLDPDVLMVEEGPSDPAEMGLFVQQHLNDGFAVYGGIDGGAQKVYALVKNGGEFLNAALASDAATAELSQEWETDVDGDGILEGYDFTRLPLVLTGTNQSSGNDMRVVALHSKSKYVHRGRQLFNDPARQQQFITEALKNRRRISTEAMRTREYLDRLVEDDQNAHILVTGDFNDGPGIDYFEKRYLTHNITDILLGSTFYPERLFVHAFITRVQLAERYTAIFDDFVDGIDNRPILLDHILVSPALEGVVTAAGIAHAEYEAQSPNIDGDRQERVSDHRPVYVDVQ